MLIVTFVGPPRTVEMHNSIAQFSRLNPQRLKGEELYNFCKGRTSY